MKKLIVVLALVIGLAVISGSASAGVVGAPRTVTASVTLTGTPFLNVTPSTISWTGVVLGTTGWKAADSLLTLEYLLGGTQFVAIYTDNAGNVAGLRGTNGSRLNMAWRVFNTAADATPAELTVYEWVYHIGTNWASKLTNQATRPIFLGEGNPANTVYPCWLWMNDGPLDPGTGTPPVAPDGTHIQTDPYLRVVGADGIQHGEYSWATWGGSPDVVAIAANFSGAQVQAYTANLQIVLYSI